MANQTLQLNNCYTVYNKQLYMHTHTLRLSTVFFIILVPQNLQQYVTMCRVCHAGHTCCQSNTSLH